MYLENLLVRTRFQENAPHNTLPQRCSAVRLGKVCELSGISKIR